MKWSPLQCQGSTGWVFRGLCSTPSVLVSFARHLGQCGGNLGQFSAKQTALNHRFFYLLIITKAAVDPKYRSVSKASWSQIWPEKTESMLLPVPHDRKEVTKPMARQWSTEFRCIGYGSYFRLRNKASGPDTVNLGGISGPLL